MSQVGFILPYHLSLAYHSQKVIDTLTGQKIQASSRLQSFTNEVSGHRVLDHEKYGNKLVLVDTPGFNNTIKSDKQVLEMISRWMVATYVGVSTYSGTIIELPKTAHLG